MRILLVDDMPELLHLGKLILEDAGFEVSAVSGADEARAVFKQTSFDVAVIDYGLGGDNGALLARELKRMNPRLKVILMSGTDVIPDWDLQIADEYLLKGQVGPRQLVSVLRKLDDVA